MCISMFMWQAHPKYPFILLHNRDEFPSRPTYPLAWWEGEANLGGRDALGGGTWLGSTRNGRIAFLTNFREVETLPLPKTRGALPLRFLQYRTPSVGLGEVDDELEDEVGSECAKYGTVTRVLIFEITEPNFPTDEAVRIFVQFERSEETTKALIDLDGRYFGGRVVRASFYDEEKFSKNKLAPMTGEIPDFT